MNGHALDRRVNAYRGDLAAAYLRGQVDVANYVEGEARQVIADAVPLREAPRHDARLETEFLFGETVRVYDEIEGWAWVQGDCDGYVGYLSADALSMDITQPTHRVRALRTYLYPEPNIKAPPLHLLTMNARVAVADEDERFLRLEGGRFAIASHLAALDVAEEDFVDVAHRFLGTPYLWGGRTSIGLDCSALVQLALQAAGVDCPRDTDMQETTLGVPLPDPHNENTYRRGDLVFWEDHTGVMLDESRLLHANAHHMAVAIEPVAGAIVRIAAVEGPVTSVRRLT